MCRRLTLLVMLLLLANVTACDKSTGRWDEAKAVEWGKAEGWVSGCNFIPSNAINQIEMWHSSTFSPELIDSELAMAEKLGFNAMRVYLSSLVWQDEAEVFKANMEEYLKIASSHNIRTIFVFFDDCWNAESAIGVQPEPEPGVHNSGWVQDPCKRFRENTEESYVVLEAYVKDILKTFSQDKRILFWDLYNEPGNSKHGDSSLPLLEKVFAWARDVNPSQPLSSGVWTKDSPIDSCQVVNSDIISYHNYGDLESHSAMVERLKVYGRPMVCTEYMSRRSGSTFETILPMLHREGVGAINWGFVSGKTNTIFAWDEKLPDVEEPELWFHDILRRDGTPFDESEVKLLIEINTSNEL
ncbi:MAG: 1,4-beta-xylanase [Rikenellaceae bacterium]